MTEQNTKVVGEDENQKPIESKKTDPSDSPTGDNADGSNDNGGEIELDGSFYKPSFIENLGVEASEESVPAGVQQELERLRDIERQYNELSSDPLYSAVVAFKKAGGKDIDVFVSKVYGDIPDPAKMSPVQIFEYDLRKTLAIEAKMDEQEIEQAVRNFSNKEKYEQVEAIRAAKKRLEDQKQEHLNRLNNELTGQAESQEKLSQQEYEYEVAAGRSFSEKIDSLVGKTWHRLSITKERADAVKSLASIYTIRDPKTRRVDVDATIQFAIPFLYLEEILKANITFGKDRGLEEGAKLGRGSNGVTRNIGTRQTAPVSTDSDAYEQWKKSRAKQ